MVRDLKFTVDHDIDLSDLEAANQELDDYKEAMADVEGVAEDMGDTTADAMNEVSVHTADATDHVQELGDSGADAAQELQEEFGEAEQGILQLGESGSSALGGLKSAIKGIMALGFVGWIHRAATTLEAAQVRITAFAREGTAEFETLNRSIQDTIELSRGIHREGELLEAAHRAAMLGTEIETMSEFMQESAVISAVTGETIEKVMHQIGRGIEIGSVRRLQEMGIITEETFGKLDEEMTQSIRNWDRQRRELLVLTGVQDYVNERMDWYNDYLETGEAQTLRFRGAIGDLIEVLGAPLIAPVATAVEGITDFIDALQEDEVGKWALQVGGWAAGILTFFSLVGVAKQYFLPFIAVGALAFVKFMPWLALIAGIGLLLEDLYTHITGGEAVLVDFWDTLDWFHTSWWDSMHTLWENLKIAWEWISTEPGNLLEGALNWMEETIEGWKESALGWIDDVVQGFIGLPGRVMEGMRDFGEDLKNVFGGALQEVRDLLPFSPAKEGPLVDLHLAGKNIVGNIQEGMQQAGPVMPARAVGAVGSGVVFSPAIHISLSGADANDPGLENRLRRIAKEVFVPELEKQWRRLAAKMVTDEEY